MNQVDDIVVCNESPVLVAFTTENLPVDGTGPGSGGQTRFDWEIINGVDIGSGTNGSGNLDFISVNNTSSIIFAEFQVTPVFINNGECPGDPITFTITVNPEPQIDLYRK